MTGGAREALLGRYLEVRGALPGNLRCERERRAAQKKAESLRDRLIAGYSPLIRYVAARVCGRTSYPLEYEDVLAWGAEGLLDAVETYDPGRGTKFETYAISKIRWSILDELRKADPLSRRLRLRLQRVERARAALAQRLGGTPSEAAVARELGVELSEHRAFLLRCQRAQVTSLEARAESGAPYAGAQHLVCDGEATDPASAAELAEVRSELLEALGALGERERLVVASYFYGGRTLREIGESLGLSEGRISQILSRALGELRPALAARYRRGIC